MIILIDGKEVKVLNDVKIIYDDVVDGDELHITCTHEGVVSDVIAEGEVVSTFSEEAIDIHSRLMNTDLNELSWNVDADLPEDELADDT